jgi:hypothetical protein
MEKYSVREAKLYLKVSGDSSEDLGRGSNKRKGYHMDDG